MILMPTIGMRGFSSSRELRVAVGLKSENMIFFQLDIPYSINIFMIMTNGFLLTFSCIETNNNTT